MSNKRNRSTKINGGKVLDGLAQGQNQREIAQTMQVHPSSIGRFLAKIKPCFNDLQDIAVHRGNVFNYLHSRSLKIQHSILDEVDRIIEENERKDHTKRMKLPSLLYCLRGIGMNQIGLYNTLRLEGGQSTSNVSLAGMVSHAHKVVGAIDPKTGDFRSSITGHKPISRLDAVDSLKPDARNELAPHETRMDSGDHESTSDKT